jgi:hypothetical protein
MSILISTNKNALSIIIIAYVYSSTKLEKRAEQVLPGCEVGGGEVREGPGGWREKWPKQGMHI